jgi:23S rRNA pseudouridine2605 synthase
MRLAKHLAHAGAASRRGAEELIRSARVTVDGETVTDPARDVSENNDVRLDGEPLSLTRDTVVYILNKPTGVLSTAKDTHGRPTVTELIGDAAEGRRLYPIGRLDADTSGLILLSDDGELAYRLTHPKFEVPKSYRARVNNPPLTDPELRRLREGIQLEDGITAPAQVRQLGPDEIQITIHEGRKRQVRRMCAAVGHPVTALKRVSFGPLRLGELRPAEHRKLSQAEVERLRKASRGKGVK